MQPLEFLAAVLPPPGHGYYCSVALPNKIHKFSTDMSDVANNAERWAPQRKDVYFALATFKTDDSREAVNASYIKSLFIDMDGYASKKEAASALSAFLARTQLDRFGTPWVVASGGGLHCYWALEQPVEIARWKPVGEALKRLCKKEALAIDMTVPADAARILRVPGTFNFKPKYPEPRPVKLLVEGCTVDFEAFSQSIFELAGPPDVEPAPALAPLALPGQRPTMSKTGVQMLANSATKFKTILLRTRDGDGCAQLAHYIERASEDGMEPLWRAMLSQAKYCDDGVKAATWLSQLHPYDPQRMNTKLREIKGPYGCDKIDSENPLVCRTCKHFGKITNPLALGRELVADTSEKEVVLPAQDPDDEPVRIKRPTPPKGYAYGANGGVYMEKIVEEADGGRRKRQVMILPYDLFVVDLLNREGEHTAHMVATRNDGPVDVLLPQRYTVSKDECIKALAQQNILAAFGAGNDVNLFGYVRACVEELSVNKRPVRVPTQYGWQDDGSMVINGQVVYPDGASRRVPMPDLENLERATRPKGTLENWRKFPQLLIKHKLYDMLAMMCIGFGSPLMRFTQMSALTFHAGSTESGTGKSLTLSAVASIMGHPVNYRTGKNTSAVTMQQRCGNLNSYAFVSDEITHKSRQDMEWFPGLIFDLAEGRGKEKSEAHHNRERVNNVSWSLLAFLTSNMHMHDYMSGSRQFSSNGELFRMLEWTPNKVLSWTDEETEIIKLLHHNHGVAGEKYVRWLVQNEDVARDITEKCVARLKREWKMTGDERYWAAGCGAVVAGAILASSRYANVVDIPVDMVIESLRKLVEKARIVVKTGARTAEDVLNAFTREHYGMFVVVKPSNGSLLAELGNGQAIDHSITRSRVMGRVEHGIDNSEFVDYYIEEQVIKAHCVAMSFGYDDFKRQISATAGYAVHFMRKDMMSKTRGPQMRVNAIRISRHRTVDEQAQVVPLAQAR